MPGPDHTHTIRTADRIGLYAAIATTILTIITFALAMTAIPNSGAFCPGDCREYPYLDTIDQYPGDYLWMIPVLPLLLSYMILMVAVYNGVDIRRKIFGQIGILFTAAAVFVLVVNYVVQLAVVTASLMNRETEGIALLTQYNPRGIFIILEEFGYLMIGLSFLFTACSLGTDVRIKRVIRRTYFTGFILSMLSFAVIMSVYGIGREDRFEVAVITIDWLVLIITGIMLSLYFRKRLNAAA